MTAIDLVRADLKSRSFPAHSEHVLQEALAAHLHGYAFEREARLCGEDRIDFLFADGLGIEVKIDGSLNAVTRQLHRYAQSDRVTELLLVTTRMRHLAMPQHFNLKRLATVHLIGSSL